MKIPARLQPLLAAHLIEDVVRQLQSGKEAEVYLVLSQGEYRCAKIYKDSNSRTFKQRVQYTEGRSVRNSRRSRAMNRKSNFGRQEAEMEWQSTEVDALAIMASAGVRVPKTYGFYEGVLLLEVIVGEDGEPAPRLSDVSLTSSEARKYHEILVRESVKMLCAGFVHGDYSEFNVLVSDKGLVIIDLPQAVQATANNAFEIFQRDLLQLAEFFSAIAPEIRATEYPHEIWELFKRGKLRPDSKLTGLFAHSTEKADIAGVMEEIEEARRDELMRLAKKND